MAEYPDKSDTNEHNLDPLGSVQPQDMVDASESSDDEKYSNYTSDEGDGQDDLDGPSLQQIREKFSHLGLVKTDDQINPHILEELSLDGIVDYIKQDRAKNIIVMAGAGISTSAGIPDFRTPGTGLYDNLQKFNLPSPTAVFDVRYFQENPKPFFALAKELYPNKFVPTPSHLFVKMLEDKSLLLRHYTQNIDTLERKAGLGVEKLVEAHGTFSSAHCINCRKEYSQEWMREKIFSDTLPKCDDCEGLVKPDIVFFGEQLPQRFHDCVSKDFSQCDLLIIMGSSLVVQPFASLIDRVPLTCPRILVNREKAGVRSDLPSILGKLGLQFDSPGNYRDVFAEGDTDAVCMQIATKLGWHENLQKMIDATKTHM